MIAATPSTAFEYWRGVGRKAAAPTSPTEAGKGILSAESVPATLDRRTHGTPSDLRRRQEAEDVSCCCISGIPEARPSEPELAPRRLSAQVRNRRMGIIPGLGAEDGYLSRCASTVL